MIISEDLLYEDKSEKWWSGLLTYAARKKYPVVLDWWETTNKERLAQNYHAVYAVGIPNLLATLYNRQIL